MLEIALKMILCLLLAALLGFIIGYLLGKHSCQKDKNRVSQDSPSAAKNHDSVAITPQQLTEPRNGQKDNLTRIKGIGVKIEEELNRVGIYHFDQIANWTEKNIAWADQTLGFPGRTKRERWVEQAKLLAAGNETEFSKRVDAGEVSTSKQS